VLGILVFHALPLRPLLRCSVLWWRALGVGSVVALNSPLVA